MLVKSILICLVLSTNNRVQAFTPSLMNQRCPSTIKKGKQLVYMLQNNNNHHDDDIVEESTTPSNELPRRDALISSLSTVVGILSTTTTKAWAEGDDGFNVDNFLKTGQVAMPMGVSGQAGKSKPQTGIVFRDGSELSREAKSGDVLTEILLDAKSDNPIAVITTFSSPWPLGM